MSFKHWHMFRCLIFSILVFSPVSLACASVVITEIMYDVEGSDTDREWIEVENTGSSVVDISKLRFNEGNTNHTLIVFQGEANLEPGGFAVIVDTPAKFLIDHSSFSGVIFDSSFSLSNTGEPLSIKDESLIELDSVTYSSEWGAVGDGNSLQKVGGQWKVGTPSPGTQNTVSSTPTSNNSSEASTTQNNSPTSTESGTHTSTSQYGASGSSVEQTIFPDAGPDKMAIAGASTLFSSIALGTKKEPLLNAQYFWNFGDGMTAQGQKVSHTYKEPGQYAVYLEVSSRDRTNVDRALVTVIETPIHFSNFTEGSSGFTELSNTSSYELDISYWQISDEAKTFILPKNTILLAKKSLRFSNEVTGVVSNKNLKLLYPSGIVAVTYGSSSQTAPKEISSLPSSKSENRETAKTKDSLKPASREISTTSMLASLDESLPETPTSSSLLWFGALGSLLILSIGGVLFIRLKSRSAGSERSGYTIIE